jgi:heme A synthase
MAGTRRGARSVLKWFSAVYVVLIVVQVFLAFVQMILPGAGRWVAALHPVNAFLLLGLFGWVFYTLRQEQPATAEAPLPAPAG